jgi:hypothetical protein
MEETMDLRGLQCGVNGFLMVKFITGRCFTQIIVAVMYVYCIDRLFENSSSISGIWPQPQPSEVIVDLYIYPSIPS